jgi:hypothetical protein
MAKDRLIHRHTRRTEKQRTERQRRDERELAKELQERAQQEAEPRLDDLPPPRID